MSVLFPVTLTLRLALAPGTKALLPGPAGQSRRIGLGPIDLDTRAGGRTPPSCKDIEADPPLEYRGLMQELRLKDRRKPILRNFKTLFPDI
ncbi:hypothetical protein MASR2M78_06010 [Treponema sp.]